MGGGPPGAIYEAILAVGMFGSSLACMAYARPPIIVEGVKRLGGQFATTA